MIARAFGLLLCLWVLSASASIETHQFNSTKIEADYHRLINELRCLVCQNQNLAGSDADLARDMRRETLSRLNEGQTPDEVIEFMVARYGDFVRYRPGFKQDTYLLWLGPLMLLAVVLIMVVWRVRHSQAEVVEEAALMRVRELLESSEKQP